MLAHDLFRIQNLRLGQMTDPVGRTGCTVLLFPEGATASVDVRGSAPGTRETDLLRPENLVDRIHAIVLTGGSAFGLAAMEGVVRWLEEQQIGFATAEATVPIVTGAVLYDLAVGDPKARPDATMGYAAARTANRTTVAEGAVGAGTGASVGKLRGMEFAAPGGLGVCARAFKNGLVVGAVVAVNALGNITDGNQIVAGIRHAGGDGFINARHFLLNGHSSRIFDRTNTTIGAVVTNATLTKAQCLKLAQMTHDAFARRIDPAHTPFDGDAIFAAATGEVDVPADPLFLGTAACAVMETAILRAVRR